MSRFTSFNVLLLISLFVISCDKSDNEVTSTPDQEQASGVNEQLSTEPVETKMIGKWKINVPRSIEKCKTSPKVKPEDFEKLPSIVEREADKLQMEITESELKITSGSREQVLGYTVTSTDADSQIITVSIKDAEDVNVVFTMIDGTYLNLVSSGSDDMNYYIWGPVK